MDAGVLVVEVVELVEVVVDVLLGLEVEVLDIGFEEISMWPFVPGAVNKQLLRSESIAQAGPVIQKVSVPYFSPLHSFR